VSSVTLGAEHRPPRHLALTRGHEVHCPLTDQREPVRRCWACGYLQGTLEEPGGTSILCAAAPRPAHRRRLIPNLVFFQDWPEAD
jgi:hypothetical protein